MKYEVKIKETLSQSAALKLKMIDERAEIINVIGMKLADVMRVGGKILLCGNGGSAADSQHLAAELVVRLRSKINRRALPAIALTVDPSIITAGGNDIGFENIFARGVEAYGNEGDALIGISTSGKSENVVRAVEQAKKQGVYTIGLLGAGGGKLAEMCDASLVVPSDITARIQEAHITVGHIWCEMIEEELFPELF